MRSPSFHGVGEGEATERRLTVEPPDVSFYTRFVGYHDLETALAEETKQLGSAADPTAQRLVVSDIDLLVSTVEPFSSSHQNLVKRTIWNRTFQVLISLTRLHQRLSFMDEFVLSSSNFNFQAFYLFCNFRLFILEKVAFGSVMIYSIYTLMVSISIRWLALEVLSYIDEPIIIRSIALGASQNLQNLITPVITIIEYYSILKFLDLLRKRTTLRKN